jgi:hypothetical protein
VQNPKVQGTKQTGFVLETGVKDESISQAATNVGTPIFIRKDVVPAIDKGPNGIVTRREERHIGVCVILSLSAYIMHKINPHTRRKELVEPVSSKHASSYKVCLIWSEAHSKNGSYGIFKLV